MNLKNLNINHKDIEQTISIVAWDKDSELIEEYKCRKITPATEKMIGMIMSCNSNYEIFVTYESLSSGIVEKIDYNNRLENEVFDILHTSQDIHDNVLICEFYNKGRFPSHLARIFDN